MSTHINGVERGLRVEPILGEPTCFYVTGQTLYCPKCGRGYRRGANNRCRKCRRVLEPHVYRVDLTSYNFNGECGCQDFATKLRKKLRASTPKEQSAGRKRCKHIRQAREFALNLSLRQHEAERLRNARGRREEDQP